VVGLGVIEILAFSQDWLVVLAVAAVNEITQHQTMVLAPQGKETMGVMDLILEVQMAVVVAAVLVQLVKTAHQHLQVVLVVLVYQIHFQALL
jgi:hypothetical protein